MPQDSTAEFKSKFSLEFLNSLYTVGQLARMLPRIGEPSLRWWIFNADKNGLLASGAIVRQGRRVFLHEEKFFEWLTHNGKPGVRAGDEHARP